LIVVQSAYLFTATTLSHAYAQVQLNSHTTHVKPGKAPAYFRHATPSGHPTSGTTGTWTGTLTSNGDPKSDYWDEELDITQDKSNNVTGTRKSVAETQPQYWVVWSVAGSVQGGVLTLNDQSILESSGDLDFCQLSSQLTLSGDGAALDGPWTASGCGGGNIDVTLSGTSPDLMLLRQDLTHVLANGTPQDGTFAYESKRLTGKSIASIDFGSGVTDTDNPNISMLTDPPNPNSQGNPSPGGLAQFTAMFTSSGQNAKQSFRSSTFGMSCYYVALESDWGSPPSSCGHVRINGKVYKGTYKNPDGLTGTYCQSFIAEVILQGSGVLNNGQDLQWIPPNIVPVGAIKGSDGTAVIAGQTVARDEGTLTQKVCPKTYNLQQSIIPVHGVKLDVNNVGTGLSANDTGCAIIGYRLDLFNGAGKASCSGYRNIISTSACTPAQAKCPGSTLQ
jgi:3D (Asp-Asp-Asp) domain-containing protein